MNNNRRIWVYAAYILVGIVLCGLGVAGVADEFWSGMGSGLMIVGVLRLVRMYRFRKNENYREMVEIAAADERNCFIRNKAWAWTGYLFILLTGSSVIILKIVGQDLLSLAASWAVCVMSFLYWVSYMVLRKKY